MISVIIATMNRAEALENISLGSLARQDCSEFEVIVWDASDSDDSRIICGKLAPEFAKKNVSLRYFKAPRIGLASQRNDAVSSAKGDICFFIDDDSEVSVDGLSSLLKCFESFPWVMGAAPSLLNKNPAAGNSAIKILATHLFGSKNSRLKRLVSKSGDLSLPIKDLPGSAEWLSGCSMAFRSTVFERLHFDERLQVFGGYSLGEDFDFSHRVMMEFGQPLMVANGGLVVHHSAKGGRITGSKRVAAHFFNPSHIRDNFKQYGERYGFLHRAWAAFGTILFLIHFGCSVGDIVKGTAMALKEMKGEKKNDSKTT